MKRKIKACHGWYKNVKFIERRMKCERETNNWRRIHGTSPRRRFTGGRRGMGKSNGSIEISDTTLEQVQEFHSWLQGKSYPNGIEFAHSLKLTPGEAFSVIYYLQEELGILPDKYEMCRECKDIYNSENEGAYINEESTVIKDGEEVDGNFPEELYGSYCDSCRPD